MGQERYNRMFMLPAHLHCEGMPFEVEAGALLVDSQTGGALAQLKMVSYADKPVKAVMVTVQPCDVRGAPLGEEVSHQYLDIYVKRGVSFGQKEPLPLPNPHSRSFTVIRVEVVYADNSTESSDGGVWEPLSEQLPLAGFLSDAELLKQYRIEYGEGCAWRLQEEGDLWRCVCGATNRADEEVCHSCGQGLARLRAIDPSTLEEHKLARLEAEEQTKRRKSQMHLKVVAGAILVVLVAAAAAMVHSCTESMRMHFKSDSAMKIAIAGVYSVDADDSDSPQLKMTLDDETLVWRTDQSNFDADKSFRITSYDPANGSFMAEENEVIVTGDGDLIFKGETYKKGGSWTKLSETSSSSSSSG